MNQQIVEYLQTNKAQFAKESLVMQLRAAGHSDNDINEAINVVYGDVLTTPMEEQPIKYAGFWIRWVAAFVDGLIVGIASVPLRLIFGVILTDMPGAVNEVLQSVIGFGLLWTYYIFMTHKFQATLGKKLMGIEVRASDASTKATLGKIVIRETLGKILSAVTLYIGYIMAGFTAKKQALHDMIGSTVVVYKDPQKKTNTAAIVVVSIAAVFVVIAIIGIFASIVLVSLNSARGKAQEASFKASVSSTLPAAIICMDEGVNILPPTEGTKICKMGEGEDYTWPILDETGEWGELIDGNVADGTFEYTATFTESGVTATCTQLGCEFSNEMMY